MAVKDRAAVGEFLKANDAQGLDVHAQRARLDSLADFFPVPAGVEVSFESWGKMIHVWHIFHAVLGEGRDAVHRIAMFLKNHLE